MNSSVFEKFFEESVLPYHVWKLIDEKIIFTAYNKAANELAEGKLKNIMGVSAREFFKKRPSIYQDLKDCFKKKKEIEKELRYKFVTTKKEKYLKISYKFIPPNIVLAAHEDLTKQKIYEEDLVNSEKRFRVLAENTFEGILICDELNVVDCNKTVLSLFKYRKRELLGQPLTKLISPHLRQNLRNYIQDTSNKHYITLGLKHSGVKFYIEIRKKEIPFKGKTMVLVSLLDINNEIKSKLKIKNSEKKYRSLFENAPFGIIICDFDGTILDYNSGLKSMPLINSTHIIGKHITDIVQKFKNAKDVKKIFENTITDLINNDPIPKIEFKALDEEGTEYWFALNITYIRYAQKSHIHFILRNITRRKVTEVMLQDWNQKLEYKIAKRTKKLRQSELKYKDAYRKANLYKDLFIHDINNILQTIRSATEMSSLLFKEKREYDQIMELQNIIKREILKGSILSSNVKILSEIMDNRIARFKIIKLKDIIQKSISFLRENFPQANLNITFNNNTSDSLINGNKLLKRALENILLNAVKHNQKEKIEINILLKEIFIQHNDFYRIEIVDNAQGFPDNIKDKVFLNRGKLNDKYKFLGLGLPLTKKIINLHKGKIWIEDKIKNDITQGSKICILLPKSV